MEPKFKDSQNILTFEVNLLPTIFFFLTAKTAILSMEEMIMGHLPT